MRVKRWRVARQDWTRKPLKIAIITDIHLGEPYVGLRRLKQIVRRTNAVNADLVVLLGDFAPGHKYISKPVEIEDAAPILAELQAPQGVYSVLGNHDWWDDRAAQRRGGGPSRYGGALEAVGIPVLSNQALKKDGYWLAGLEDQIALRRRTANGRRFQGLDDLPATMAQVDDDGAPCILLAHEPYVVQRVPERVSLTLSGHTHGGQVQIFGWAPAVSRRFGSRYRYGHIQENGRDLIVSGGIGCSILPIRLGVVPEITVVEIAGV
nr:metallophosphoesterase [Epibacterium ulvae]